MRGMLFSQMEPPAAMEPEFNDWYDTEHIPHRLEVKGFARADRYVEVDRDRRYLAVYQLSDLGALETPEYRRIKAEPSERTRRMLDSVEGFTRYTCEMVSDTGDAGPHTNLFAVAFAVPDEQVAAFDDFYETEHTPMLMEADAWMRVRRYRVLTGAGGPWTHFALHELADTSALDSDELAAARQAPKRVALAEHEWFQQSGRWLYRRLTRT